MNIIKGLAVVAVAGVTLGVVAAAAVVVGGAVIIHLSSRTWS